MAELAVVAGAPAADFAGAEQRAAVAVHLDVERTADAGDQPRCPDLAGVCGAGLALEGPAPAIHLAVAQRYAGRGVADRDVARVRERRDLDRGERVGIGVVAQATAFAVAPAEDL